MATFVDAAGEHADADSAPSMRTSRSDFHGHSGEVHLEDSRRPGREPHEVGRRRSSCAVTWRGSREPLLCAGSVRDVPIYVRKTAYDSDWNLDFSEVEIALNLDFLGVENDPVTEPIPNQRRSRLVTKTEEALIAPIPTGTRRWVQGRHHLHGKATAVIGMRRAGKTTFLHQVRRDLLASGARREQLPYVNFEDELLVGMPATSLGILVEEHFRRCPDLRGKATVTWCFDEIQVVPGWERFVRRLLDSENIDVFVSGSSAAMLSREIATAMRGRAWEVVIHPFSFREFLAHRGEPAPAPDALLDSASRSRLERAFQEYLTTGGFPEAQGLEPASRFQLLRDYVDVAMMRDVVERHRVSNVVGVRWLMRHLLGNAGGTFSVEKFYRALRSQGISIARQTVHELVGHLQDCFLVRALWMETDSERQRMANPRKAYPIDPGLIPVFDRTGRANVGHALETAVLIELERRRCEVTYVRTPDGFEVDFFAKQATGELELIQVCADASDPVVAARELRALAEAGKAYPAAARRLLLATRDGLPADVPVGIQAETVYEWALRSGEPA
ncbi:MAG: ATP-binding protein [Planctomycetes bacterium]|nr:ATP-binding protein [Planctomycetota bacterium]